MTTSGASIAARAAARSNATGPPCGAVEDEVAGDRDPQRGGVEPAAGARRALRASSGGSPAASRTAASASRAFPAAPAMRPQFGSRPWAAALTRLLTDDRARDGPGLGVVACARDLARDERRGALAVGRLLAGQVAGDRLDAPRRARRPRRPGADRRRARGAGREDEDRVVGARVAVDRSWFQVRAAAGRRSAPEDGRLDRRVGQDDRQHRGHARVDHPHALGDAADA